MPVTIREAVAGDLAAVVTLLDQLGHSADERTLRSRFERLVAAGPGNRVLVAEADGSVVGLATLHVTPVLHRPTGVGRVTALVVHERHRGRGIGEALVRAGERVLADFGCARIEITSAHVRAHAFYRRLGYADEGIRFARNLGGA